MLGTTAVGVEEAAAADEVRAHRYRIDRSHLPPSHGGDLGTIVGIAHGSSRAVDADRTHERATEPRGRAEVMPGTDKRIARRHKVSFEVARRARRG